MKKKILLGLRFKKEGFTNLQSAEFELIYPEKYSFSREELMQKIIDVDVLVPGRETDKEIIDKGKNLKLIANYGVGYDGIDVEYATSKGITVTNTPKAVLEPTAELCFGLLIATARRIAFYDRKIRTEEKFRLKLYDYPGLSIYGKTLGIFGMGRIGQALAKRAVASGMNIIYHNRKRLPAETEKMYQAEYVSFEDLLKNSDFLSLNAPFTKETYHLLGEKEYEMMKESAILINASRGAVVDEKVLIKALQNNVIRGAGLDVFEDEPRISHEFKKMDNVVLTPHAGTQTLEAKLNMQRELEENIIGFFEGKAISKVN